MTLKRLLSVAALCTTLLATGLSGVASAGDVDKDSDIDLTTGRGAGDDTAEPECSDLESLDTCDKFTSGDSSTSDDLDGDDRPTIRDVLFARLAGGDTAEPECSDLESLDTCDKFTSGDRAEGILLPGIAKARR